MPSCYAYGCTNSNTKEECKDIRFFRIPPEGRHPERRKLWLNAIRRRGEPYKAARICSAHFISGAPSSAGDKENPDYIPSVFNFPASHKAVGDANQKYNRYSRRRARSSLETADLNVIDIVTDSECEQEETEQGTVPADHSEEIGCSLPAMEAEQLHGTTSTQTDDTGKQDAATSTEGSDPAQLRTIIHNLLEKNQELEDKCAALQMENERLKDAETNHGLSGRERARLRLCCGRHCRGCLDGGHRAAVTGEGHYGLSASPVERAREVGTGAARAECRRSVRSGSHEQ